MTKRKEQPEQKSVAKRLADFRAQYDRDYIVPQLIRKAIRDLGQGGWSYEADFSRAAGVSLADLAAYRSEFEGFWVQIKRDGKRAWAGSKALATAMRKMI